VPAWSYARQTIFNPHSRACLWRHPLRAARMIAGAGHNYLLAGGERLRTSTRHECPVCRWQGRSFRTYISPDSVIPGCICPRCGSFDRQRFLVFGMRKALDEKAPIPRTLLGLSLSPAMSYLLAHEGLGRCFRSDFDRRDPRFQPDVIADLRQAGFGDGAFDWILCSHVLEHIPQLPAAVDELVRLLRPGGRAWIQIAYLEELTTSHPIELDPHDFDAHAWRFGADFTALLQRPGWTVVAEQALTLPAAVRRRHGIHPVERYWVGRKDP
jgi:SAM-dependent methyltransferase